MTLAIKDLFDTAGVRTTYGSAVFADHVPDTTATAVARLEAAGYTSVGKANLHEFAWGITSEKPHYGAVPNPIAPTHRGRLDGGSAAALAAGLADAALGTDSGRLDPHPRRVLRDHRLQADPRPRAHRRLLPARQELRPRRPDGPRRPRLRGHDGGRSRPGRTEIPTVGDLADLARRVAWTAHADPLVRERVEPRPRPSRAGRARLPLPGSTSTQFLARAVKVHETCSASSASSTAERATKLERAWPSRRRGRGRSAERTATAGGSPRSPGLRPRPRARRSDRRAAAGVGDLALREHVILLTFPWSVVGAPVLALPCGPAELGLPASLRLVGRPGDDAPRPRRGRAAEERRSRAGRRHPRSPVQRGRRTDRQGAAHQPRRAALGPRVRLRDHAGHRAARARPDVGRASGARCSCSRSCGGHGRRSSGRRTRRTPTRRHCASAVPGDGARLRRRPQAPHACGETRTFFAIAYAGVRFLHLALYADASRRGNASWAAIAGFAVTVGDRDGAARRRRDRRTAPRVVLWTAAVRSTTPAPPG